MPRKTALDALERCRRNGAWSSQTLSALIDRRQLDTRDAALCSRLFLGTLQNLYYLDFCIDRLAKGKLEPKLRDILRLGAYQILFMDRIPNRAAVNESVKLCRDGGYARAAGLVNAVLRKMADAPMPEVPESGSAKHLSIRYSHPLWMVEELIAARGHDGAEAVLDADNRAVPTFIQTNTLRISSQELAKKLGAKVHSTIPDCLILENSGSIAAMPEFQAGLFYVQDPAARMSVSIASPKARMRVLDACSAPGGKSFAAAMDMENTGEILACDISAAKLYLVAEGAERMGLSCIRCEVQDASQFDGKNFDLVMADVPCSGWGVIRKKPDIRYRSREDIAALPKLQSSILNNLAKAVKPDGVLAYSTCTWRKQENADVTHAFIASHPEFQIETERTFWPDTDETDGFYICRMRRKKLI